MTDDAPAVERRGAMQNPVPFRRRSTCESSMAVAWSLTDGDRPDPSQLGIGSELVQRSASGRNGTDSAPRAATLTTVERRSGESGSTPRISVVIPARNEAQNVAHVLQRVPRWVDEVILVDGGSTDGTVAVACEEWPSLRVVHQTGRGKGAALVHGFREASGDIIVLLDADGSTDPAEIPRFVAALRSGADLAKGTRFVTGGGSADLTPLRRRGNRALVRLVNALWGTSHSDLCYGYMAFWRQCLEKVNIDCEGFEIETLIVLRFLRANVRIIEVPSFETARFSGQSSLRAFGDGVRIVRTILSERLRP